MSEQKATTPPPAVNTGNKPNVNQPVKKVEVAPVVAAEPVQAEQEPASGAPAAPVTAAPAVVNRGVAPTAPAAKAAEIATRQQAAAAKAAPVSAAPGSKTAAMLGNLKKAEAGKVNPAELVADIIKSVPKAYCYPIDRVCTYIVRMDPNKAENREAGAVEQSALYNAITNIINNQEAHFAPLFTALLKLFATYNGPREVFHDFNSSRFMEVVNLNSDDRKAFNNLVCFLKTFAEPKTRDIAKRTTDHSRLLAYGLTDAGRNRVMSFLEL